MLLKDLQKTELCVFAQCKELFRIMVLKCWNLLV